jgi:hypothetical protein
MNTNWKFNDKVKIVKCSGSWTNPSVLLSGNLKNPSAFSIQDRVSPSPIGIHIVNQFKFNTVTKRPKDKNYKDDFWKRYFIKLLTPLYRIDYVTFWRTLSTIFSSYMSVVRFEKCVLIVNPLILGIINLIENQALRATNSLTAKANPNIC